MYPSSVFSMLNDASLHSSFLLGVPVRAYPFGDAPPNTPRPYLTFQLVSGIPDNCLDDPPDMDNERVQFSLWADNLDSLDLVAKTLRARLQQFGYVNSYADMGRDTETRRYGIMIDWSRLEPPVELGAPPIQD